MSSLGCTCYPNILTVCHSRFEDVDDEEKAETKPAKRPRESDAMDTDAPKPSKAEKKKNKKMKAENGTAVPSGTDTKEGEKSGDSEKKPEVKEKKKKEKKEKEKESKSVELPGGLKIVDAKIGTGPMSKAGNKLKMRYIGKLDNGKVFDSNTKGKPVRFTDHFTVTFSNPSFVVHLQARCRGGDQRHVNR